MPVSQRGLKCDGASNREPTQYDTVRWNTPIVGEFVDKAIYLYHARFDGGNFFRKPWVYVDVAIVPNGCRVAREKLVGSGGGSGVLKGDVSGAERYSGGGGVKLLT